MQESNAEYLGNKKAIMSLIKEISRKIKLDFYPLETYINSLKDTYPPHRNKKIEYIRWTLEAMSKIFKDWVEEFLDYGILNEALSQNKKTWYIKLLRETIDKFQI